MAAAIASGRPCNFSVSSVIIPKVPSEPTINLVKSYPAEDFRDLLPVLIILPFASTTSRPRTFSRIVPYLTAVVPDARVAAIPPKEAFAPGSTGKNKPSDLNSLFSCSLVTPGCTITSMSSGFILSTLSICIISRQIPPLLAKAFPSNDVPVPQATRGHSSS